MSRMAPRARTCVGVWTATCLCGALTVATAAASQNPPPCQAAVFTLAEAADFLRVETDEMERLAEVGGVPGRRIGATWRFGCAALMAWLKGERDDAATTSGAAGFPSSRPPVPIATAGLTDVAARGTTVVPGTLQAPGTPPAGDRQDVPIGESPAERTAEDVFLRGQRVLLGRGDVVVDVGQFYARRDSLQLAATDAGVELATIEQRALTTFLAGRVGIFNETELFATTSFQKQNGRLFSGTATLESSERAAFGPTSLGIRRTVLGEGRSRPDVIVTLIGQIPRDDTAGAVGGGLVLVKSVDPVVIFTNLNYLHAFERDATLPSRTPPVDVVDVSMGYGLGLNDTVAISMAVSGLFTRATTVGGGSTRPSVFSARFALTTWLAEGLYLEPSISFGLSGPGESFALGVTMPYAF